MSGVADGLALEPVVTQRLSVSISGKSSFHGENLQSQRARVGVSGIGDVKVWAIQELAVTVSGVGTVDYWGPATVSRRTSGIARINDRGAKRDRAP